MLKNFAIALMAVMVFAIPLGASADATTPEHYSLVTGYSNLVVTESLTGRDRWNISSETGASFKAYVSDDVHKVLNIKSSDGSDFVVRRQWWSPSESRWIWDNSYDSSGGSIAIAGGTTKIYHSTFSVKLGSYTGDTFFLAPPPPPKPVQLKAVETVQEIVPQAGAVAGGIVLVASILLGLWLVIGLVRRLVFSFLR